MSSKSDKFGLFQKVKTRFVVDLHPSRLVDIEEGVKEHLNSLLTRYNEELDGIVLSYCDERITSQSNIIHPYFPLVRVAATAILCIFKPIQGARIVGNVIKVSEEYIGLHVLGFINANIFISETDFRMGSDNDTWVNTKDSKHKIAVGDDVSFTVIDVRFDDTTAAIVGSMYGKGNMGNTNTVGIQWERPKKKSKKKDDDGKEKRKKKKKDGESNEEKRKKRRRNGNADATDSGAKEKKKKKGKKS